MDTTLYSPFGLTSPESSIYIAGTRAAPAPPVPRHGCTASPERDILATISSKGSERLAPLFPTSQNTTFDMKPPMLSSDFP